MVDRRASATTLLSLAAGAVAAAAVGTAWVPLSREAERRERASLTEQLSVVAEVGRLQIDAALSAGRDPSGLAPMLEALRSAAEVDRAALLVDGEASAWTGAQAPPLPTACGAVAPGGVTTVVAQGTHGACVGLARPGAVLLVESRGDFDQALSAARLRATLVFVALGLLVGLVVIVSTRWILSPVRLVSAAAARIARGERGVTVDVTGPDEIAQLAHAVNTLATSVEQREDEIAARVDVVNQLTSMVAHEVRNPLQSLSLLCTLARTEPEEDTRNQLLEKVESEIHVLEEVVQRFLRSSGPLQISRSRTDLVEVLGRAAAVAEAEARTRDVTLMIQAPGTLRCTIDGSLVRRALENLMLNAIEFAAQRPPGQVTAAVIPRGKEALLIVEDDGPGVPEDDRSRIFQAYYSTKSGGTGLGLALVKQVFEAHGGSIRCEPSPLGGARFEAALPLQGPGGAG